MPETASSYRNSITLDISEALAQLTKLKEEAAALQASLFSGAIKPTIDLSDLNSKITEIKTQVSSIKGQSIRINVNTEAAKASLTEFSNFVKQLTSSPISIPISVSVSPEAILQASSQINKALSQIKADVPVGLVVDNAQVSSVIATLRERLAAEALSIPVRVQYIESGGYGGGGYGGGGGGYGGGGGVYSGSGGNLVDFIPDELEDEGRRATGNLTDVADDFGEVAQQTRRTRRTTSQINETVQETAARLGLNVREITGSTVRIQTPQRGEHGRFISKPESIQSISEQVEQLKRALGESGIKRSIQYAIPGSEGGIARGPYRIEDIPLSRINVRTADFQMREALNESRVAEIKKSLEAGDLSQLTEIAVWRARNLEGVSQDVLISGHHRLEAAKRAKDPSGKPLFSGISARVYENIGFDEARLLSEVENINVKGYSPYEMSKRMAEIRKTSDTAGGYAPNIDYNVIEDRYGGAIKKSTLRNMWHASFLPEEWMRSMSMGSDADQQRLLGISAPFGEQAALGNIPYGELDKIFKNVILPGKVSDSKSAEIMAKRLGALRSGSISSDLRGQGTLFDWSVLGDAGKIDTLAIETNITKSRGTIRNSASSLINRLNEMNTGGEDTELSRTISQIEPQLNNIIELSKQDIETMMSTTDTTITGQYVDAIRRKEEEALARAARGKARAARLHRIIDIKRAMNVPPPIIPPTTPVAVGLGDEPNRIPIGRANMFGESPLSFERGRPSIYGDEQGFRTLRHLGFMPELGNITPGWDIGTGNWQLSQEEFSYLKQYEEYKAPPTKGRRRIASMPGMQNIRKELDAMLGTTQKTEAQIAESIRKSIARLPILTREQSSEATQLLNLIPDNVLATTKELRDIRLQENIRVNVSSPEHYKQIMTEHGKQMADLALAGQAFATGAYEPGKGITLARTAQNAALGNLPVGASDVTLFHEIAHALNIPSTGNAEQRPAIIGWLRSQGINVPDDLAQKYRPLSLREESSRWVESQRLMRSERALSSAGSFREPYFRNPLLRQFPVPLDILRGQLEQSETYRRMGLSQDVLSGAVNRVGMHRLEGMVPPVSYNDPSEAELFRRLYKYGAAPQNQSLLSKITTGIYRGPLRGLMTSPLTFGQVPKGGMWDVWEDKLLDRSTQPGLGGKVAGGILDILGAPEELYGQARRSNFGRSLAAGYGAFKTELQESKQRKIVEGQVSQSKRIATELTRRAYQSFLERGVSETVQELLASGVSFEQARDIAEKQVYGILYGQKYPSAKGGAQSGTQNLMFSLPGTGGQKSPSAGSMAGLYANNANPAYGPGGGGLAGGPFTPGGMLRHAMFFAEGSMIYVVLSSIMEAVQEFVATATQEAEKLSGVSARISFVTGLSPEITGRYIQSEALRAYTYGVAPSEALDAQLTAARSRPGQYGDQRELMAGAAQISILSGEEMGKTMESLITLQRQYNIESGQTQKIVDVVAYAYKNSTDSIDSLTDALARSGSATKMMGLNLEESFAVISGISEVSTRTGTSIAAMLTQMSRVMYSTTGKSLLASVGIGVTQDGKERSTWDVITEAAGVWKTDITDAQRRAIATGIGGPRYSSDVAAFLQNFEEINRSRQSAQQEAGGSMQQLQESLKDDVGYQVQRSKAARELYLRQPGAGINVIRRAYSNWIERYYSAKAFDSMLTDENVVKQLGLKGDFGLNITGLPGLAGLNQIIKTDPTKELYKSVSKETGLKGVELDREVALRIANAQDVVSGLPSGSTAKAQGLAPAELYRTLDLLGTNKMTGPEADQLTKAVLEWEKKLEEQGFTQENQVEKNILVQRGIDQKIESIVGTAEAIQLATAEIAENTKLRGVWNIPTGWVPIDSIFSGVTQKPSQFTDFGTTTRDYLNTQELMRRKPEEQRQLIEDAFVGGMDKSERKKAVELPMLSRGAGYSGESNAEKVGEILRIEKDQALSSPYVASGSRDVPKSTTEVTSGGASNISITIPVVLDGEKVGEAVAIVNGNDLLRNIRSGGNYGSHNASVVGGVI